MPAEPAQLEWVWLSRVNFNVNPEFERNDIGKTTYYVEPDTDVALLNAEESGARSAVVTLSATIEWEREGDGPLPFEMQIDVGGHFRWNERAPDEQLARLWLDYNGMYLLWPYLRSYITTITAMAPVPPLTIYTMNVPEPPDVESDEGEGRAQLLQNDHSKS
jgi:preprotein translocase subunit SecB